MTNQQIKAPVILIADDEPDFADIIAEVARDIGFQTRCVHEGDKVVSEVEACDPVAIVLDLRMPGADGVEILRELALGNCAAKIVLMSGMDQRTLHSVEALGKEKNLQIVGTLTKPMRPQEIQAILAPIYDAAPQPVVPEAAPAAEPETEIGLQNFYTPFKHLVNSDANESNRIGVHSQWRLDNGELLSKSQYQQWADKSGISKGLFKLMLGKALALCESFYQQELAVELVVSLDSIFLHDHSTADFIAGIVAKTKVPSDRIIIEVAEEGVSKSHGDAIDVMSRLRIKGFKIAVKTESSDESLLVMLDKFPLDEIYVDVYPLISRGNLQGNMEVEFNYSSLTSVLRNKGIVTCATNITQENLLEFVSGCGFIWAEGSQVSAALSDTELVKFLAQ